MDCCSCVQVIWLPHSASMFVLLLRPTRYGLAVQRVASHNHLKIHSIGSLRKVALLGHLEKSVGVQDKRCFWPTRLVYPPNAELHRVGSITWAEHQPQASK